MEYLRQQGPAVWVVAEAYSMPERARRELFRKVKSDAALYQRRARMKRVLWLEVLESVPSVHTNIIITMPDQAAVAQLIERFFNSANGARLYAQAVTDWDRLPGYLAGEATSQAWFKARRAFPRTRGSHPLGEGGGDRVRLSRDLEAALLRSGKIEPRRRTYARRSLPPIPETVRLPDLNGLFGLLPDGSVPFRSRVPVKRHKLVIAAQIPLAFDMPPDAIDLMMGLGSNHSEISERVGLSRQQTTAILGRQFGASRQVVRRVLELARPR